MKWSIRLGRFAGIDVYLHVTFLLLVGVLAFLFWQEGRTLAAAASGVGFYLSLFACVLLHEFGHALTARRYGIRTHDITLLPIGGLARLERMPDKPMQEFWVALAGPAVNVVIAGVIFLVLRLTDGLAPLDRIGLTGGTFWQRLMMVNLLLVGFNLLPAFPMDGGRVLRSLLALRLDYARATRIAATIGQFMALVFGFYGLVQGAPTLFIIAFFVWFGASQEVGAAQMKSVLADLRVERAMLTDFETLAPADPLQRAVDLTLAGSQHDFPVLENGAVVGILTRAELMGGLARSGPEALVVGLMQREFPTATADEPLTEVIIRLQGAKVSTMPIFSQSKLVGLLTPENIGEFVMIREALGQARRARPQPPVIVQRS